MTRGRTVNKYTRVYVNGYNMSGHANAIGPLSQSFEEGDDAPLNAAIKGVWLGQGTISPGTLNAMFDNTATTGIHALLGSPPALKTVMVAQGIQAEPAQGDPVFMGQFRQDDYMVAPEGVPSMVTVKFGPTSQQTSTDNATTAYGQPWGVLLHAEVAVTTDNADVGVDMSSYGYGTSDPSTDGGWMCYQVTSCNGTAAIKVQDATTNEAGDFADLLTTGTLDFSSPTAGVVPLATTASVKNFVRWQVEWGTATTITFLLGFVRGRPR